MIGIRGQGNALKENGKIGTEDGKLLTFDNLLD